MKYFLVFYDDEVDQSQEAANTYYSWLVMASSKEEAIQKFVAQNEHREGPEGFAAQEMDLIK